MDPTQAQEIVEEVYRLRAQLSELSKTLSGESLLFLKDFMTRVNTQDNWSTATPIYYQIQETFDEQTCDCDADEYCWVDEEYAVVARDYDELHDWVIEQLQPSSVLSAEESATKIDQFVKESLAGNIEDYIEENLRGLLTRRGIKQEQRLTGFFFTEQACKDHIEANHYHYKNPRTYVSHGWRNPELARLLEVLGELTGMPYVKH